MEGEKNICPCNKAKKQNKTLQISNFSSYLYLQIDIFCGPNFQFNVMHVLLISNLSFKSGVSNSRSSRITVLHVLDVSLLQHTWFKWLDHHQLVIQVSTGLLTNQSSESSKTCRTARPGVWDRCFKFSSGPETPLYLDVRPTTVFFSIIPDKWL